MESTPVAKRDTKQVGKIWKQINDQMREWEEYSVTSLYGEATPSVEIGQLQKKFAKVNSNSYSFDFKLSNYRKTQDFCWRSLVRMELT